MEDASKTRLLFLSKQIKLYNMSSTMKQLDDILDYYISRIEETNEMKPFTEESKNERDIVICGDRYLGNEYSYEIWNGDKICHILEGIEGAPWNEVNRFSIERTKLDDKGNHVTYTFWYCASIEESTTDWEDEDKLFYRLGVLEYSDDWNMGTKVHVYQKCN